ncbi:MAG: hypothetical protein HY335_00965, partial [Deinococcus sp.]|nr:hypothetical protein [Deinococcus sp.]
MENLAVREQDRRHQEADISRRQDASHSPKVGMVLAFTGHYDSVKLLARFLELAGVDLVKSRLSTPKIIEAGTTFASADFCLPLRVYVGHVLHLVQEHPDLDCIVAPNILSEDGISSTCSKYRDVGGVAIRSLGDTVGYLLARADEESRARLTELAGADAIQMRLEKARHLPAFIMPNIRSLDYVDMRNVCYDVYADIKGWSKTQKVAFFLPGGLKPRLAPQLARVEAAFAQAYSEVVEGQRSRLEQLLADQTKPRLALVGRRYLINDPALTCDLKTWFQKRGATVLSASDLPRDLLWQSYHQVDGYYDTHLEGQAFINWAADKVDGMISLGSFGCHPDAFQVDYLAEWARAQRVPTWTLRYDESAGSAGFHTRYETIFAFLEQRRDQRLAGKQGQRLVAVTPDSEGIQLPMAPLAPGGRKVSGHPGQFSDQGRNAPAPPAVAKPKRPLI